jgi:hypothetical protein
MSACECGRCGEQFSGIKSFDQHQRADYKAGTLTCLPPASLGLVRNRHGRWAFPPDPAKPNPWASRR